MDPERPITLLDKATLQLTIADLIKPGVSGVHFPPVLFGPYIADVEVTQSIQYYEAATHLTDPADRAPNNSIRLAALKPAWVRVYVRSGLVLAGGSVLSGEILVEHRTGPFLTQWIPVGTVPASWPGSVTTQANPNYVTERSSVAWTLNFTIPPNLMYGMVRLTVRVWRAADPTQTTVDTVQRTVDATTLPTLKLRGIFVAYDGPDPTQTPPVTNVVLAAPTVANLQTTAAFTLTTMPLEAQGQFSSGGTMNWFAPLTGVATEPGGCSAEWEAINWWLSKMKQHDGNRTDVIYYGLLPAAMPIANVGGCEIYGVSAGPDTFGPTMAHEIGHAAGLLHGPCGTSGKKVDSSYPAYEPYDPAKTPMASIGEYGLDIRNGTIHPPADKDFMSYCPPNFWISLHNYGWLFGNDRFSPRRVGVQHYVPPDLVDPFLWPWEYMPDPPPWEIGPHIRQKAEPIVAILGFVDAERGLDVKSVARLLALRGDTSGSTPTPFVAELIGESGQVVSRAPVMRSEARGHGCGCHGGGSGDPERGPYLFQALLADVEPGRQLRIVKPGRGDTADREMWTRNAPARRPKVSRFVVKLERRGGVATWEATGARDRELEYALQFSKDRGRSWNCLTVGVTGNEHRFALNDLPTGPVVFRLLVHDGFFTTTSDSRPVTLPPRPPVVGIMHPQPGPVLFAGAPMRLWGGVMTDDGSRIDEEACSWRIDGRQVARGSDAYIETPAPGDHRCTFVVKGRGGRAEVNVTFRTVDPSAIGAALAPMSLARVPQPRRPARRRPARRTRRR